MMIVDGDDSRGDDSGVGDGDFDDDGSRCY